MWALRFNGNLKVQKANFSVNKPCFLCNNFLRRGEELIFVIIPAQYRGTHKNLKENFYCHKDEWLEFVKDCSTYDDVAEKLKKHKKPKRESLTDEDAIKIRAFEKAAFKFGFTEDIKRPYGIKMKIPKSSAYAEYNVYADQFIVEYNNKVGLFETFVESEMHSRILNEMNKLLGNGGEVEIKSAIQEVNKVLSNTIETVNKIINN